MRQTPAFELMHWAKARSEKADYSLGVSGIPSPSVERFPELLQGVLSENPFHSTGNYFGAPELKAEVAEMHGVTEDSVLITDGTSLANYTAFASLAEPGQTTLVERPSYSIFDSIFRFHGIESIEWPRDPAAAWLPSLDRVREAARTHPPLRAAVLTRLHNPSGCDIPEAWLRDLADLADELDLNVVFDEVYLDFLPDPRPAHDFSPRFVSTGGVTKAYGFGGLRVGWVIGAPETIRPLRELSFYLAVNGSSWAQSVALRILRNRSKIMDRSRLLAARGFEVVKDWVDSRPDVHWTAPVAGLNSFVNVERVPDTIAFTEKLFREKQVAVAPGDHFGMPGWLRISWGAGVPRVTEALHRLGESLDDVR